MCNDTKILVEIISKKTEQLFASLESFIRERAPKVILNYSSWKSDLFPLVSYLSCETDPSQNSDSLDIVVTLKKNENEYTLFADASWSSGEVLFETQSFIIQQDQGSLNQTINKYIGVICREIYSNREQVLAVLVEKLV
jgi:hypothetical protein